MQEFSHLSRQSAPDLVAALNDSAAAGWSVVSVTHAGADGFVAILARDSATTPATETVVVAAVETAPAPVAEPAGWAAAPQPTPQPSPQPTPQPVAQPQPQPAAVTPTVQVAATTPAANIPANWYADPSGRFELRYWDGQKWTEHVARGGQQFTDPPTR